MRKWLLPFGSFYLGCRLVGLGSEFGTGAFIVLGFSIVCGQALHLLNQLAHRQPIEMVSPWKLLGRGFGFWVAWILGGLPLFALAELAHDGEGPFAAINLFLCTVWCLLWPALLANSAQRLQFWQGANWWGALKLYWKMGSQGLRAWIYTICLWLVGMIAVGLLSSAGIWVTCLGLALVCLGQVCLWAHFLGRILRPVEIPNDEEGIGFSPF